jgi:hypothetical protein
MVLLMWTALSVVGAALLVFQMPHSIEDFKSDVGRWHRMGRWVTAHFRLPMLLVGTALLMVAVHGNARWIVLGAILVFLFVQIQVSSRQATRRQADEPAAAVQAPPAIEPQQPPTATADDPVTRREIIYDEDGSGRVAGEEIVRKSGRRDAAAMPETFHAGVRVPPPVDPGAELPSRELTPEEEEFLLRPPRRIGEPMELPKEWQDSARAEAIGRARRVADHVRELIKAADAPPPFNIITGTPQARALWVVSKDQQTLGRYANELHGHVLVAVEGLRTYASHKELERLYQNPRNVGDLRTIAGLLEALADFAMPQVKGLAEERVEASPSTPVKKEAPAPKLELTCGNDPEFHDVEYLQKPIKLLKVRNLTDETVRGVRAEIRSVSPPLPKGGPPITLRWRGLYRTKTDIGPKGWDYLVIAPLPGWDDWGSSQEREITVIVWDEDSEATSARFNVLGAGRKDVDRPWLYPLDDA